MTSPRSIARAAARRNARQTRSSARNRDRVWNLRTASPTAAQGRLRNLRTLTGSVYLASSPRTYTTARYEAMRAHVQSAFPDADVLLARDLFSSNDDWRRRWPELLPTLAALVCFTDDDGYLDRGTYIELSGTYEVGIPVWLLDDDGQLHRIDDTSFAMMPVGYSGGEDESDVVFFPNVTTDEDGMRMDWRRFVSIAYAQRGLTGDELMALLDRCLASRAAPS